MDIASRVAGHIAADPVVMDAVAHPEAVGHHWGEAAEVDSRTGQGAGGQDVVVDGGVSGVSVQAVQSLTLGVSQIPHGKEVSVKTLA